MLCVFPCILRQHTICCHYSISVKCNNHNEKVFPSILYRSLSLFLHLSLAFQNKFSTKYNNNKIEWKILWNNNNNKTAIYLFLGWCLCYYFFTLYLYSSSSNGFNTLYYIIYFFFIFSRVFSSSQYFGSVLRFLYFFYILYLIVMEISLRDKCFLLVFRYKFYFIDFFSFCFEFVDDS